MTPTSARIDEDFTARFYRREPIVLELQLEDADGAAEDLANRRFFAALYQPSGEVFDRVEATIANGTNGRPYLSFAFHGDITDALYEQQLLRYALGEQLDSGQDVIVDGVLKILPAPTGTATTTAAIVDGIATRFMRRLEVAGRSRIVVSERGPAGLSAAQIAVAANDIDEPTPKAFMDYVRSMAGDVANEAATTKVNDLITATGEAFSQSQADLDAHLAGKDAQIDAAVVDAQTSVTGFLAGAQAQLDSKAPNALSPFGATARAALDRAIDVVHSADIACIDATGAIDSAAGISQLFYKAALLGKTALVGPGRYLIAGAGSKLGGIRVQMTKSLRVRCDPGAVFFTDNIDNDMIVIEAPSDGAGISSELIEIVWEGGWIDHSKQKVPTSVPDLAGYPPPAGLEGSPGSVSGMTIRGYYFASDGTTLKQGFRRVVVRGLTTYGGKHWQLAGGDTGLAIGDGSGEVLVEGCEHIGSRDVGQYLTGSQSRFTSKCNRFSHSYSGVGFKRSTSFWVCTDNHFENVCRAISTSRILGRGVIAGHASGNSFRNCSQLYRLAETIGAVVEVGTAELMGALLADGTKFPGYPLVVVNLAGSTYCQVSDGRVLSTDPTNSGYAMISYESTTINGVTTLSQYNWLRNVVGIAGCTTGGTEIPGQSDNNYFEGVVGYQDTVPQYPQVSASSHVLRRTANGQPAFRTQILMDDGTPAKPIIARVNQPSTGIYFDTNIVAFGINGSSRLSVNTISATIRMPGYASDAAAATGGLVANQTYYNPTTRAVSIKS
ncbi:hypothetical protein [Sphingomonas sp. Leaf38]|uniref:hypothetical protein n=1 Tax=Sphingomonas sp. Leaf38 TaxID=1736217 RepID=UPI0006F93039|nr:hypothetical protein [Sphingomonas sp. Leaf38]KQN29711.1 hypothetical protein ASE88_12685 [Sphingomonas sp. Leaf38]